LAQDSYVVECREVIFVKHNFGLVFDRVLNGFKVFRIEKDRVYNEEGHAGYCSYTYSPLRRIDERGPRYPGVGENWGVYV